MANTSSCYQSTMICNDDSGPEKNTKTFWLNEITRQEKHSKKWSTNDENVTCLLILRNYVKDIKNYLVLYNSLYFSGLYCKRKVFFEKVMLLFPRFYIVKEKFWIPFSGEKEKVREEPTKVIKSSHGTKMKEWTETERILAKQNFFLEVFCM